jgi:nickel-dependent lactate racemase
LLNPIDSKPLPEVAKGKNRIVIISTDATRLTKDHLMIPSILNVLAQAGVGEEKIEVIIGRGQHREMTEEEVEQKLGRDVLDRVTVVQHNPDRNLVDFGATRRGNRVLVNSEAAGADLRISTGNIVPHGYAGFGGGAKSILPGVCGRETIYRNHLYVVEGKSRPGFLEDNPIRIEMEEAAAMVGLNFIVNTVMNSEGRIVKVFAGHFLRGHREGTRLAKDLLCVQMPSRAEVVVSSGSPMDIDFYQASRALEMGDQAVADGGVYILASPCYEVVGEKDLYRFLTLRSPEEILRELRQPRPSANLVSGVAAYLMAKMRERIEIVLVSDGLKREQVEAMGFKKADSVQVAVGKSLEKKGKDSRAVVFPQGPITLPLPPDDSQIFI